MSPRSEALAVRLEAGAAALAAFAFTLSETEWQMRLPKDGRKVGVVVHHVASMYPTEIHLAALLAAGKPVTDVTWDAIDTINRDHAKAARTAGARNYGCRNLRPRTARPDRHRTADSHIFEKTPGVVDVDWYVEDDQPKYTIRLDREKAALNGITGQDAARVLRLASAVDSEGLIHAADEKEDVPIVVGLERASRSGLERLKSLKLRGRGENLVALGEIARIERAIEDKSITIRT